MARCNAVLRGFSGCGGIVARLPFKGVLHGFFGGLCGGLLSVRGRLCLRGLGGGFCNAVYILISGSSVYGGRRFYFISGYALGCFTLYIHGRLFLRGCVFSLHRIESSIELPFCMSCSAYVKSKAGRFKQPCRKRTHKAGIKRFLVQRVKFILFTRYYVFEYRLKEGLEVFFRGFRAHVCNVSAYGISNARVLYHSAKRTTYSTASSFFGYTKAKAGYTTKNGL